MKLSLSKSLFTKSSIDSTNNGKFSLRLVYKLESPDSEDVWIYFDSNFTIPSYLKFAGFLVYGTSKFDLNNLESLNVDLNKHKEFYVLCVENDMCDLSSLNESLSCYKVNFESGKQSNLSIPLEDIKLVEDDDSELSCRNLCLMNVSLLLLSKLSFEESENNPFTNGLHTLDKLPNDLVSDVVNAFKNHSSTFLSEDPPCSLSYSDPFEPVKDPFTHFFQTYTLGFGFDSRSRKHAFVVSGAYKDFRLCVRLLFQTNVALPANQIVEEDELNKLLLYKLNEQLLKLCTLLEKESSSLYFYVSNDCIDDDEHLFKHEQEEDPDKSETKVSKPNRSGGKKSSGKGKSSKNTSKSSQATKKTTPKKTVFNLLPSLEFCGSIYSLNFDSKTGCLSLSLNKFSKEPDPNNNKTTLNLVLKFIMSSANTSQHHVPHGGASFPFFNYTSDSNFNIDGIIEYNDYCVYSKIKFVFNPYEVVDRSILISPHRSGNAHPPWISPKKSSVYSVDGNYQYYHYTQCGVNDTGWGCCYRSLQLVCSWYLLQYRTPKLVPTHSIIQQVLKENDLSHKDLKIGSSTWIGTVESGYFLNWYLGYTYKTLYLNDVSEFRNYNVVIADHFKSQGTPIIVGAGAYAYVILGICLENEGGEVAYLIADPHYTGDDTVKNVLTKGGIGWKKIEFLSKASDGKFINLCLPQLEQYCA